MSEMIYLCEFYVHMTHIPVGAIDPEISSRLSNMLPIGCQIIEYYSLIIIFGNHVTGEHSEKPRCLVSS